MKQSIFTIIENIPLTDSVYRMVLGGDTSAITASGQFVNIKLEGMYLRRPISVCDCEGDTLTLVDDGSSVHILVNGRTITSILLRGETEYPEHFASVIPLIRFAKTAEILLADGHTATVQNTLVASTCQAQCGAAIRGGALYFDEISLIPYSEHSDRE